MKKTTISDIAQVAGVSKTTVSRYLNHQYERMSIGTQQKIKQTISDLHYSPNRSAQSLKKNKSLTIGISVADISNSYTSRLFKGINEVLNSTAYQVIIVDSDNNSALETSNLTKLVNDGIDGLIIQPLTADSNHYQTLIDMKIPTIQVDRYIDTQIWPSVVSDNIDKSYQVAQLIQQKSYTHVIVITNCAKSISSRKNRIKGLKAGLIDSSIKATILDIDQLADWEATLLDELHSHQRVALYALNGHILRETIRLLKSQNLAFPTDVGLIGYDDDNFADLITPSVSAITQNPLGIGQLAAKQLLDIINAPSSIPPKKIEIPSRMDIRESL
ncbi:LacI family DNA-binding transcriptional regulator [Weissella viridescens]|uniref:LacI family DNA-binding transcriptional regulator n=1 Tax=Weissella viridescens TaxID=1629 RepID=UPI003AF29C53